MRKLLLILAALPLLANAEQPLFGDGYVTSCVQGMLDGVAARTGGPGNADVWKVIEACGCMQAELNRSVSPVAFKSAKKGNTAEMNQKVADAYKKCLTVKITK